MFEEGAHLQRTLEPPNMKEKEDERGENKKDLREYTYLIARGDSSNLFSTQYGASYALWTKHLFCNAFVYKRMSIREKLIVCIYIDRNWT